jgi:Fur family ferric uptake transcriptional regulator/Fur family peroxide stress response transcriptional regulator
MRTAESINVKSDQDLIELLRARGQRVTPQRLVIHRVLRERDRHLSADEVREAVKHDLPGTSTPTVYATLDLLAELGLVRRIDVGTGATLFDSRSDHHHHTVCRDCGQVADLCAPNDLSPILDAAARASFQPEQVDLVVSGLCRDCARPAASPARRRAPEPRKKRG